MIKASGFDVRQAQVAPSPSRGRRRVPGAVIAAIAAATLLHAQSPQPNPTFRSDINYVELPVRVLNAKGAFVRDLQQSDFQIFEDGKQQEIAAFSSVEHPVRIPSHLRGTSAHGT